MIPANSLPKAGVGKAMWEALAARYDKELFVDVEPLTDGSEADEMSFDPQEFNDTNRISLRVLPHQSGHVILMARLDNLGKGAAVWRSRTDHARRQRRHQTTVKRLT
jgi:N-acetyl-gamma-glutamyl-phosphate reductase